MKIAFISYEYPPDTAYGGIATYVHQAARMLRGLGHHVEVFAGTEQQERLSEEDGILTHRIRERDPTRFAEPAGRRFAERHSAIRFDVLEGPEYMADARVAVEQVPDIPLVVKLHTPSRLLLQLNYRQSFRRSLWLYAWGLRHGHKTTWRYSPEIEGHRANAMRLDEIERAHALCADEIATPSRSLGEILAVEWGLDRQRIACVPYPYVPDPGLLEIPVQTRTDVVTFIGRLEVRKGMLDLAEAIPQVLRRCPGARFRLVGAAEPSPQPGQDMREFLEARLQSHRGSIDFTGPVAPEEIPSLLATSDICVFPSVWENFPCVCLEAMAAGRAIVASGAGGMADMLLDGDVGRIIRPRNPRGLARAVIGLLEQPDARHRLGAAARDRLLSEYGARNIGSLQLASYERAIARRRALGPRRESRS